MSRGVKEKKVSSEAQSLSDKIGKVDEKLLANADQRRVLLTEKRDLEKALESLLEKERLEKFGALLARLPKDQGDALIARLSGLSDGDLAKLASENLATGNASVVAADAAVLEAN